ncbi:MAG: hypothetical protein FWG18_01550 [Alphaproteobacteria bacterium]|nr:hypothetical protein [Alphaproteobacteria bacterium]
MIIFACAGAGALCIVEDVWANDETGIEYVGANENSPGNVTDSKGEFAFAPTNVPTVTCAQQVFANALIATAGDVAETDPEFLIQGWIYRNFQKPEVIRAVLACPEIAALDDEETIQFPPVGFKFPLGREIIVNYMTQPKILQQRLLLADKRELPGVCPRSENSNYSIPKMAVNGDCATARVGPDEHGTIWTNTEPAWYGIAVVQAGAWDEFVGVGKNHTVSLKYIEDHLDDFYPHNHNRGGGAISLGGLITIPMCTSQSALADDGDIVNIAANRTVGADAGFFTGNDFYIAGDRNLQWITWAEVGFDVAITVVTMGAGTGALAVTKSIRAGKATRGVLETIKGLRKVDKVLEFEKAGRTIAKSERLLEAVKSPAKIAENIKEIEVAITKLDRVKDADKITDMAKQIDALKTLQNEARFLGRPELLKMEKELAEMDRVLENARRGIGGYSPAQIADISRDAERIRGELRSFDNAAELKKFENELDALRKSKAELEKVDDVKKYNEAMKTLGDLQAYRHRLNAWKIPQRGNIVARGVRSIKAAYSGNKVLTKGAKVARAGMGSVPAKVGDWLIMNTLKNAGAVSKAVAASGFLYGALKFVGDMYDWSETSTGQFTSNIEFKPLLLLSADNLEGQENIVGHGMWIMFAGDSVNPVDDDAAFLQAMDFAEKFYQDMEEVQYELGADNLDRAARAAAVKRKNPANAPATNPDGTVKEPEAATATTVGANNAARLAKAAATPFGFLLAGNGVPAGFCNVDIYVVRPIIRNPDPEGGGELFYLIMNDEPWRVRAE